MHKYLYTGMLSCSTAVCILPSSLAKLGSWPSLELRPWLAFISPAPDSGRVEGLPQQVDSRVPGPDGLERPASRSRTVFRTARTTHACLLLCAAQELFFVGLQVS